MAARGSPMMLDEVRIERIRERVEESVAVAD